MNQEFFTFLRGLGEVSKNIWIDAVISMKRNGTATIVKRDVLLKYRISEDEFKKLFYPKDAENLNLIKILAEGETFISINFRKRVTEVKLDKPQKTQEEKAVKAKKIINPENTETTEKQLVVSKPQNNIILNEFGLIISDIDANYVMTEKCKRYIIVDYTIFFKKLQANKSFLAGATNFVPVSPKISGLEIKKFKEIATYFISIGCTNEVKIILAFQRIYNNWEFLPERIQRVCTPAWICMCLNEIIQEISALTKTKQPKPTAKDEQFNSKVDAARQKDYSHLAKS